MKTLKFLWKSLYQNAIILENEQKWWLAIIIFLVCIVGTISGSLYSGYTSNASGIISTSTDTGIDKGFAQFASDIDEKGILYIEDGKLSADSSKVNTLEVTPLNKEAFNSDASGNSVIHNASYTYTHLNGESTVNVLKVYILTGDLDPAGNSSDSTFVTNFINSSIYLNDVNGTATWTPCSFLIITPTSIHIATYKTTAISTSSSSEVSSTTSSSSAASSSTSSSSAVVSFGGTYKDITSFDFYSLGHKVGDDGSVTVLSETEVSNNVVDLINTAYYPIRNSSIWYTVGIYSAINAGVIIIAGLIFWLVSRSKNSLIHYNLWQAEKNIVFMSFSPALITFVFSFFISSYSSFLFLIMLAMRMMSATTKLNGGSSGKDESKPVYKARS